MAPTAWMGPIAWMAPIAWMIQAAEWLWDWLLESAMWMCHLFHQMNFPLVTDGWKIGGIQQCKEIHHCSTPHYKVQLPKPLKIHINAVIFKVIICFNTNTNSMAINGLGFLMVFFHGFLYHFYFITALLKIAMKSFPFQLFSYLPKRYNIPNST